MTAYNEFLKLLEQKGYINQISLAVNYIPMNLLPDEKKKEIIKGCISSSMTIILKEDKEIKEAFDKAACKLIFEKLFDDIKVKLDPTKDITDSIMSVFETLGKLKK